MSRFLEEIAIEFWSMVDWDDNDYERCWDWKGKLNKKGYGRYHCRTLHETAAYVVAWRLHFNKPPLEKGLVLRHTCDRRPCCNPYHLIPGTQQENMQDAMERGRLPTGELWRKYHPKNNP